MDSSEANVSRLNEGDIRARESLTSQSFFFFHVLGPQEVYSLNVVFEEEEEKKGNRETLTNELRELKTAVWKYIKEHFKSVELF